MATGTKTLTEDTYTSYRSTWTISITHADVSVTGSSFSVSIPTVQAKYVYSTKAYGSVDLQGSLIIDGKTDLFACYANYFRDSSAMTSGTTYTIQPYSSATEVNTLTTSDFWNANNKTQRSLPITFMHQASIELSSWKQEGTQQSSTQRNYYFRENSIWSVQVCYATLNAPPTSSGITGTYGTPQYAGLGEYTATIGTASAQYGGDISSITLTIGGESSTKNYSSPSVSNQTITLTPSVAGTYTPTVTVTDTRGQTTSTSLSQITVNAYTAPSMSFDLARCDVDGIPQAEGEYGLVTANITYVDAIAELTKPTVSVKDSSDSTIISSTTWYETWDAVNGVSDAVNWTNYNPTSPVTLYAIVSATGSEFSPNESYTVSITPTDNMGGVAQTISQTLATGFFTIDFQAGGKEIAFGAPANDTLTQKQQQIGLFKCAMDTNFNDMTSQEVDDFVDELNVSGADLDTTQADWIVEQGTSGVWTYRKWNSGVAECWGTKDWTISSWSQWTSSGNVYYSNYSGTTAYPTNLFTATPTLTVRVGLSTGDCWQGTTATNSKTQAPDLYALRMGVGSTNITAHGDMHAIGRWK